jgi:hypothetical protein
MNEDAEQIEARLRREPGQEIEWIRQNNLIYGGLIGVAVVLIQPFLTVASLDVPATVSVVAFAVAIPVLAALLMLNAQEAFQRRVARSLFVDIVKAVAQSSAFVGVVAAFWHIDWIAGLAILISTAAGVAVHSAGYWRLIRDRP